MFDVQNKGLRGLEPLSEKNSLWKINLIQMRVYKWACFPAKSKECSLD